MQGMLTTAVEIREHLALGGQDTQHQNKTKDAKITPARVL
jgi:hypothetical protein